MKNTLNILFWIITFTFIHFTTLAYSKPYEKQINSNNGNDFYDIFTTEVSPQATTYFKLQSNGSTHHLEQNPLNPLNMHACLIFTAYPGPLAVRSTRYFYTTDGGSTWEYIGIVPTSSSGFPCLTFTTDNRAIILAHSTEGGGILRTQIFVDVAPGAGSWTRLDPGTTGSTINPIWAHGVYIPGGKLLFCSSQQIPSDTLFRNVCINLNAPGTFTGYQPITTGSTGQKYACAVANNERWAIAYLVNGGAKLIETADGGLTWGSPLAAWNWNPADSMGTLRGIDCGYNGTVPNVVFEVCKVDPTGGTFYPLSPAKIYFWAPNINGGNPVKIDSAGGLSGTNPTNNVFTSVCRPVIGYHNNGFAIYVAYSKARSDTSALGNNYFDVYTSCTTTDGAGWSLPMRITNNSGPLRDCRYVSISNKNAPIYYSGAINLTYLSDAEPVGDSTLAKLMYSRVSNFSCTPIGITNTNYEIPMVYSLKQNYPNPFNPTTQIEFSLPKESFVQVLIYNSIGQEIGALINEKLSAGNYKVDWDGSNYPSGVYFYVLKSDDFFDSKKMMLIK